MKSVNTDGSHDGHIRALEAELHRDKMLRTRIVGNHALASTAIDDVKASGKIIQDAAGKDVIVPAGYMQDAGSLFAETAGKLLALIEGDDNRANAQRLLNVLQFRMVMQEAKLLDLMRVYQVHHSSMHSRTQVMFQAIVADAIQLTDGSMADVPARLAGLSEPEWNFQQIPQHEGAHNTDWVNYLAYYGDKVIPVSVFSFSLVEEMPGPAGEPLMSMIFDHSLQMVVTQAGTAIAPRDIGAWKIPSKEDEEKYNWDTSEDIARSYHTRYQKVLAMARAEQAAAEKAAQAGTGAGLILPPGVSEGEAPKLILPT